MATTLDLPAATFNDRCVAASVLLASSRWSGLLVLDAADEDARVALTRSFVARGDRAGALAQYDRLAATLGEASFYARPGAEADEVRAAALALVADGRAVAGLPSQQVRFCHAPSVTPDPMNLARMGRAYTPGDEHLGR